MGLIEHAQNTHWRSKTSACFFLFSRRWRSHDSTNNRRTVYGLGPRPGPQGRGLDQPQPHGGGGHREGRPGDRPGVPRATAATSTPSGHALANCHGDPAGATIYVTLEPCCHHGRQPPCTDAILDAGITRVVVGSGDPNPLVAGKGLDILRSHGVAVDDGRAATPSATPSTTSSSTTSSTGRPYVVMKYAMTLDGKIAAYTGASRWITGEAARRHVHRTAQPLPPPSWWASARSSRTTPCSPAASRAAGIPLRVICDSHLRTPLDRQVVRTAREVPTHPGHLRRPRSCAPAPYRGRRAAGCWTPVPERSGPRGPDRPHGAAGQDGYRQRPAWRAAATLNWAAAGGGSGPAGSQAYIAPQALGRHGRAKSPVGRARALRTPDQAADRCKTAAVTRRWAGHLARKRSERR